MEQLNFKLLTYIIKSEEREERFSETSDFFKRRFVKVLSDDAYLNEGGSLFQSLGAALALDLGFISSKG